MECVSDPAYNQYHWTVSGVTRAFELAIVVLGVSAFLGGLWMRRSGPRPVALVAAVLYGSGTILVGRSHDLATLYLTYAVIGGAGLGLGYIVPVGVLIRWFAHNRGLITGLAVAGFGAGALITAPIAEILIRIVSVSNTFSVLGAAYLVLVLLAATLMNNPAEGYAPAGLVRPAARDSTAPAFTLSQALGTWQWYGLWLILFLNTMAGIAVLSQASPMAREVSHVSTASAAGLVDIISIANGSGRFLWAWLSDATGCKSMFVAMLLLQAGAFLRSPGYRVSRT